MARILYGVHGTGHGHAMRGLILARSLPGHEFLFVANDDAPAVLEPEFQVARLPNLGTAFKNYRVDLAATIRRSLPLLAGFRKYVARALDIIGRFRPDVCITDLEPFVPAAAARAGIPCLTLDHQHTLTLCRHNLPASLLWDAALQGLTPRFLFRPTAANLLISFYQPPVRPGWNAAVKPPILRQKTLGLVPESGEDILVYQSNSRDRRLLDFLASSTRRVCHVYGYAETSAKTGNIVFHKRDEDEFGERLAKCAYVIMGGSHTLMSEALYLGKPVLSIPLLAMLEQRINALYLQRLGYGIQASMAELGPGLLADFEQRLPEFRQAIAAGDFCGNAAVFAIVDKFAASRKLPQFD
ncbi:MAG: teichoic acid biosynthesis protein [Desulfovibrio sp.]|nr:teichoic acid biosynthesis protein [Desulfovibrio sp.]